MSSVAKFRDLLQGAKGTQSYQFSHMHACAVSALSCKKFHLIKQQRYFSKFEVFYVFSTLGTINFQTCDLFGDLVDAAKHR